jgi:lysozyme family protein
MSLNEVLDLIVDLEGEYSADPGDRGGRTQYGITEEVARRYGISDVRSITPDQARRIYLDYLPEHFARLRPSFVALFLHFAVLTGRHRAVERLQYVLGVTRDGVTTEGGETHRALMQRLANETSRHRLYVEYAVVQQWYLLSLVERSLSQQRFLRGWLRRVLVVLGWAMEHDDETA